MKIYEILRDPAGYYVLTSNKISYERLFSSLNKVRIKNTYKYVNVAYNDNELMLGDLVRKYFDSEAEALIALKNHLERLEKLEIFS